MERGKRSSGSDSLAIPYSFETQSNLSDIGAIESVDRSALTRALSAKTSLGVFYPGTRPSNDSHTLVVREKSMNDKDCIPSGLKTQAKDLQSLSSNFLKTYSDRRRIGGNQHRL